MLALWITTDDPDRARAWARVPRLRGVMVEVAGDATAVPADAVAVAFLGAIAVDEASVAGLLRERKHVLLAVEPGLSSEALRSLADIARGAGVQLAVVNADRHVPSRQAIKQQIPTTLGNVGLVRVHRWQPSNTPPVANPLGLPGPLIRDLDLVLWLKGQMPDVVFALERVATEGQTVGRYLQVHLGFADGMAVLDYNNRLPPGDDYQSLSVIGATGAAYADDHANRQLAFRGGPPQAYRAEETDAQLTGLLQEFVDAIAANRDLSQTVISYCNALALAAAVSESLAVGRSVTLGGA